MDAMEINNSGTKARDGLSGGVDRADAIGVGIGVCGRRNRRNFHAEQALDLGQCGQDALFGPRLHLCGGELKQGCEMTVTRDAEPSAQRALAHSNVDFCTQLRESFALDTGFRPENVRAQLVARHASGLLDGYASLRRHSAAVVPAGNRRRLDAKKLGKSLLATCRLNCSIEG